MTCAALREPDRDRGGSDSRRCARCGRRSFAVGAVGSQLGSLARAADRALHQDQALRIRDRRRSGPCVLNRPREPARPDGQPASDRRLDPRRRCISAHREAVHRTRTTKPPGGSLLAYDLRRGRTLWHRTYSFGIDSMAISPNGRWIYMPAGEGSSDGRWRIIAARNGRPTSRSIEGPAGAHNTIMGPDGRYLYLGGVDYPYLEVASTRTDKVVRILGPLNGPGVRPFTINGSQTLAFTTARSFLGFQVASITTGKVLYTVPVAGFSFDPATFGRTPDHGIALSPDEHQLYLIDTPNGYVHVFDVHGLPASPPRLVANIRLAHPPPNDGWLQTSRNGRYLYVGRSGDVIDTRARRVVDHLSPLQDTADFLEIDWRRGRPVATTNRYGVGYAHPVRG